MTGRGRELPHSGHTMDKTSAADTAAQGSNMDSKFLPEGEEMQ